MTHIVGVVEGYYEYIDKFMKFWEGRTYANGKARVRPRIILPVHFGINECGKEEFLADLKSFTDLHGNMRADTGKTKNRFFFLVKLLRKIFPKIKSIEKDIMKIKCSGLRKREGKKGNHFILSFYPIGEIEDEHFDGREIV